MLRFILVVALSALSAHAESFRIKYDRIADFGGVQVTVTGHGTAFGLTEDTALTAMHNVSDEKGNFYKDLLIEYPQGWLRCTVVQFSKKLDICIIKLPQKVVPYELGQDADLNDSIVLVGSRRGTPLEEYKGKIIEHFYCGDVRSVMEVTFDHGDSGGPVLKDGKVVGIAVSGIPKGPDLDNTKGLFVPVSVIRIFLKGDV